MAIISQGLELMKPDYFHYLPLRWRQSKRAGTQAGETAPGPVATREPQCEGAGLMASLLQRLMEAQAHSEPRETQILPEKHHRRRYWERQRERTTVKVQEQRRERCVYKKHRTIKNYQRERRRAEKGVPGLLIPIPISTVRSYFVKWSRNKDNFPILMLQDPSGVSCHLER